MEALIKAVCVTDDCGPEEAVEIIEEWLQDIRDGADPEEVLHDNGLEPDYVLDLLFYL